VRKVGLEGAALSLAEAKGGRPVARVVGLDEGDAPAVAVDAHPPGQAGFGDGRQPPGNDSGCTRTMSQGERP